MATNPRRIYNLPEQPDTRVEVEMTPTVIRSPAMHSKCGWTPFDSMEVAAQVRRVILRGDVVFEDGVVTAVPGSGQIIPLNAA
jgi:carbamoyl-phosphate synthase/aspartate carbamoyltransferase/dihydroorotase